MNRNRTKIQYMVSTIFCISFSIVYAAGVYSALNDDQRNEMPNYKQDEIRCVKNTIFFNVFVAIFLAAVFNSKKIIKLGTF